MVDSFKGRKSGERSLESKDSSRGIGKLIGKSCCLVLRDQMIEVRSPMPEVRKDDGSWMRDFVKWKLTQIGLSKKSRNAGLVNPYIFDELDVRCQSVLVVRRNFDSDIEPRTSCIDILFFENCIEEII